MRVSAGALAMAAAVAVSCESAPPAPARGALEGDLVARVGEERIGAQTVRRIAAAQSVSTDEAMRLAVVDGLFAAEAREHAAPWARDRAESRVLARLLLAELAREVRAQGAPTDTEVEAKTAKYWVRVARPASVVVGNAVVLVPEGSADDVWAKAERVAKRIVEAARPAAKQLSQGQGTYDFDTGAVGDPTGGLGEFLRVSSEVDAEGLKVVPQPTPPFAADNLTVTKAKEERQPFDETFVAAAIKLAPGELVGPVRTKFGLHVIVGVLQIPSEQLDLETRRQRFADEIYSDRVRRLTEGLLADLRSRHTVEVERSSDASLSEIQVSR